MMTNLDNWSKTMQNTSCFYLLALITKIIFILIDLPDHTNIRFKYRNDNIILE